jgi:hypothetical protein
MKLSDEKKGLLFKMLGIKSLYETGIEFGFDKHYKDVRAVNNAVYKVYQQVRVEPEKFGISQDVVEMIVTNVSNRNLGKREGVLKEKNEAIEKQDIKELTLSGRKAAMQLLQAKMDRIAKSKKKLDETPITSLAQVFGILFDKSQIIQGQATENVAVLAKIDKNISPEQAIAAVLKMREINNEEKEKAKK